MDAIAQDRDAWNGAQEAWRYRSKFMRAGVSRREMCARATRKTCSRVAKA